MIGVTMVEKIDGDYDMDLTKLEQADQENPAR
jgi:hypothetical protein